MCKMQDWQQHLIECAEEARYQQAIANEQGDAWEPPHLELSSESAENLTDLPF